MATATGGFGGLRRKKVSPMSDLTSNPVSIYPPGYDRSPNDTVDKTGGITTTRQTPGQRAAQADFDKNVLPGLSEHAPTNIRQGPSAEAMLASRAARTKADPYDLDYAETGGFGSQQQLSGQPATTVPAPTPISPVNRTDGLTAKSPTPPPPGPPPVPAAIGPLASVTNGPYNRVAQFEPAGSGLKVPAAVPAASNEAQPQPAPTPTGTPAATANVLPSPPNPAAAPAPTPDTRVVAAPPVPGTGRTTEAGVSNSQAAQFTQPTAANPVPQTPTSPVMDINDYDKRNKKPFAGF